MKRSHEKRNRVTISGTLGCVSRPVFSLIELGCRKCESGLEPTAIYNPHYAPFDTSLPYICTRKLTASGRGPTGGKSLRMSPGFHPMLAYHTAVDRAFDCAQSCAQSLHRSVAH